MSQVRIRYEPNFDATMVTHQSFKMNSYGSWFLTNGDYVNGGVGDWGAGLGLLSVYVDDLYSPVLITPMDLGNTFNNHYQPLTLGENYVSNIHPLHTF